MAKLNRVAEFGGAILTVPQFVNRTESGWQVRVRGVPSQHFADAHYGGAKQALAEAAQAVPPLVRARAVQPKN
jgi:hypothetical protein